jgi:biofilm PGA synthesis lipoprotein PgaB
VRIAGELGMPVALTLDDGANAPATPLSALRRVLIEHNPTLAEFTLEERGPLYVEPLRVVQVDLDDVYAPDPAQAERNLSALLDRIEVLKPTHVYLRATADTNGDGIADAAYFPNRHLPLRADLFSRVAWQLESRNEVKIFAMMPVAALRLPPGAVADVYEDLARHANFEGAVFDEAAPAFGGGAAFEFTRRLALRVRAFRAPLRTVIATSSTQNLAALAAEYDYVALAGHTEYPIADRALRRKVVFMQQNRPDPGNASLMAARMRTLHLGGNLSFGYGPDDFVRGNPPLAQIAPEMSLRVHPLAIEKKER